MEEGWGEVETMALWSKGLHIGYIIVRIWKSFCWDCRNSLFHIQSGGPCGSSHYFYRAYMGFTGEWQLQADKYIALQWNNVPYFDVKQDSASKYLHSHTVLIWWDNLSFRFSNFIAILCVWFQLPPQGRRSPGPAWRARTRIRLTSGGKRRGFASPSAVWSSPRASTGLCCVWLASTRCVWP